jgi:hypothetical protein
MALLLKAISNSETTLMISTDSSLPESDGVIKIGSEIIIYDELYMGTLYGCIRGARSTIPASHVNGSLISLIDFYESTSTPIVTGDITADSSKISLSGSTFNAVIGSGISIDLGTVNLNDLADVNAPLPVLDDVLTWNGLAWINQVSAITTPPSFLVTNNSPLTDVTGDNTIYTMLWPNEVSDPFNVISGGVFTAPANGLYLFSATVSIEGIDTGHSAKYITLATSVGNYNFNFQDSLAEAAQSLTVTMIIPLSLSDTAFINITVAGGSKTIDITGNSSYCFFSGVKVG